MALATVQSTFLGSATTTERNSQLVNRNLKPGTIFFNITTSTFQITITGGNSPIWQDLSTQAFVGSEIGNITPASIGAPQTDGTGATGTWGVDITGNSSTVTTNADLTGPVQSSGNLTTIPNGNITVDMLEAAAKPTFQNCYDTDSNFDLDTNPFTIKSELVTTQNQNSYSGTAPTSLFVGDRIRGFKFTASPGAGETMRVTHLQYVDANFNIAFGSTREVGIYDVITENLLGQATVSKAGPLVGGFRTAALVTPINLVSGQEYTVVAVVPDGESAYSGATLIPAAEVTSAVLADGPASSVLVFPTFFGTFANQISAGGFEYQLLSNDNVFLADDEKIECRETIEITSPIQDNTVTGLVLKAVADGPIALGDALKISVSTANTVGLAEQKDQVIGFARNSATVGQTVAYCAIGAAQAELKSSASATFGELLKVSDENGKLEQTGGGNAVASAMSSAGPGGPIMVHTLFGPDEGK